MVFCGPRNVKGGQDLAGAHDFLHPATYPRCLVALLASALKVEQLAYLVVVKMELSSKISVWLPVQSP